jgi:hypothetical protein
MKQIIETANNNGVSFETRTMSQADAISGNTSVLPGARAAVSPC